MITTMKYRLKPTKTQVAVMYRTLDVCRETYNLSLETKIVAYENSKVHLSNFDLTGMYTHALDRQRRCSFVGGFVCDRDVNAGCNIVDGRER